jgi:hypothetical protein
MDVACAPNYASRERLSLLSVIDKLTDAIGRCELIHQTAVPLNYARHALRSLTLWFFTLPFCLVKHLGLMTGPVTTTLQEKRRCAVTFQTNHQQPPKTIKHLNELEFDADADTLLANVWHPNVLLRIDPNSGQVLRVHDMSQLHPCQDRSSKAGSFNGIAIVVETPNEPWVTGKWWPQMHCPTHGVKEFC